jgi:hypothetical protein
MALILWEKTPTGSGGTNSRIRFVAAAPICCASDLLAQNRSRAEAMLPTVGALAKKPVAPSSITSE